MKGEIGEGGVKSIVATGPGPASHLVRGWPTFGASLPYHDEADQARVEIEGFDRLVESPMAAIAHKIARDGGLVPPFRIAVATDRLIAQRMAKQKAVLAPGPVEADFEFLPVGAEIGDADAEEGSEIIEDFPHLRAEDELEAALHGAILL